MENQIGKPNWETNQKVYLANTQIKQENLKMKSINQRKRFLKCAEIFFVELNLKFAKKLMSNSILIKNYKLLMNDKNFCKSKKGIADPIPFKHCSLKS